MTTFKVSASKLVGQLQVPPSKSHTLRAIMLASLADGESKVSNYLQSPDTEAMISACRQLGATIDVSATELVINGVAGKPQLADDVINAGNSGQVLRFIPPIAALCSGITVITGDASIRHNRPLQPLLDGLNGLSTSCETSRNDGFAPAIIRGPLRAGSTRLNGRDSQPVSALLFAASLLDGETEITVDEPGELPWIDLTLSWLDRLGVTYQHDNYQHYRVKGGKVWSGFNYTVPSDFSSLAFPVAAALLTQSTLVIDNVDMSDVQGDKQLLNLLQQMGAKLEFAGNTLTVLPSGKLQAIDCNINDCIDAVTILAVVASCSEGTMRIRGAAIAKTKECDRLQAITTELSKMGANIVEVTDGLDIVGGELKASNLNSYHDHRMVLSLAVAAMVAQGETVIDDTDCIAKTYGNFANDMQQLGANIEVVA